MSGLAGWVDVHRDLRTEPDAIRAMTDALAGRGPDGGGCWVSQHAALGHRRLAVVDLADGGAQPFTATISGGTVVAALAGRIANASELRRELGCALRTRSDAEVLAHAYARWSGGLAERLDGAFAFAIWDARERRLLLGRDRFGVKPLYYYEYPGGLLFGSEPKGIMAHRLFEPRLDVATLPIVLQPRLAMAGETPLVGLREVPPAHVLAYAPARLALRRYWQLTSAPHHASFDDTVRTVRMLLAEAVRRELVCDVRRGAMLSGGVDSTSVAALGLEALRAEDPRATLDTFCVEFETDPAHFVATELRPDVDAPYAARAAEHLGSRHHAVALSVQDLDDAIPATRRARDLPGWGQFDASMYLLFRAMRGRCTVALTGEAADEIFGGYPYCFDPELIRRPAFPWLGDAPRLSDYLSPEVTRRVDPAADERARYAQLIAQVPRLPGEDPVDARMREVLYLGMCGPLSVILDRKDRMSAGLGLEVRIPFCDHRLVEYVWNVPWELKSRGGAKGLLKAAMADALPPSTLHRKKSAYPHVHSPEHDRALAREAMRLVEDRRSHIASLFDIARLKQLIAALGGGAGALAGRAFPGGARPTYMLIHLTELERWIEDHHVSVR